ncbi:MAG TPA: hypothetical protein VD833_15810 [Vicinamibacterales bacterium]|nr:hypothetical protein [Vicinamibacterales bacterium]
MHSEAAPAKHHPQGASLYRLYVLALAAAVGGNLLIRLGDRAGWPSQAGQALLAVLTALPLFAAAVLFWRLLRRDLDELLQRIVLEGLAFALVIWVPLAALYINLHTAGVWTPRLDAPDLVMAPALLAAIGMAVASRRYS